MSIRSVMIGITVLLSLAIAVAAHAESHEKELGIAELISEIRSELIEAEVMRKNAGHAPLFFTKKLDLELSFVVEKSGSGEGGSTSGSLLSEQRENIPSRAFRRFVYSWKRKSRR